MIPSVPQPGNPPLAVLLEMIPDHLLIDSMALCPHGRMVIPAVHKNMHMTLPERERILLWFHYLSAPPCFLCNFPGGYGKKSAKLPEKWLCTLFPMAQSYADCFISSISAVFLAIWFQNIRSFPSTTFILSAILFLSISMAVLYSFW